MKGYCILDAQVNNIEKFESYLKRAARYVAKYNGKYIILGGQFAVPEGSYRPTFLIVIEFPSYEKLNQWYYSEEYRELKTTRFSASVSNVIFAEGI